MSQASVNGDEIIRPYGTVSAVVIVNQSLVAREGRVNVQDYPFPGLQLEGPLKHEGHQGVEARLVSPVVDLLVGASKGSISQIRQARG